MTERTPGEDQDPRGISSNSYNTGDDGTVPFDAPTYADDPVDVPVYVKLRHLDADGNLVLADEQELPLCVPPAPAGPAVSGLDFPSFANIDGLSLNGQAKQAGDAIRLVDGGDEKRGSVYSTSPVDVTKSFSTSFRVHLDGTADGVAFVLQNRGSDAITSDERWGGSSLGYRSLKPYVAIDLNLYGHRTAVQVSDDRSRTEAPFPDGVDDPNTFDYYGWVDYSAASHRMHVYLSPTPERPAAPTMVKVDVDIAKVLGDGPVYAGFAGATGGETMTADLLSWRFGDLTEQAATPTPDPDYQPEDVRQHMGGFGTTYGAFLALNPVTITSNHTRLGKITDYGDGSYDWDATGLYRASGPQTITVTATDPEGRKATESFVFMPYEHGSGTLTSSLTCFDGSTQGELTATGLRTYATVYYLRAQDERAQTGYGIGLSDDDGDGTATDGFTLTTDMAQPGDSLWLALAQADDPYNYAEDAVRVRFETDCANAPADSDNDGVDDAADVFPNDYREWADSDADKVGDNADAFPNDPGESADADDDGVGDHADAFPNDPAE